MVSNLEALDLLTRQVLDRLLIEPGSQIRLVLVQSWVARFDGQRLSIHGDLERHIQPNCPAWLTFECDDGEFSISMECDSYAYEAIGLIYEVWKSRSVDPDLDLSYHLQAALNTLRLRWSGEGDPISEREQRKYIGELQAVLAAHSILGTEAIEAWDPSGHALRDLHTDNWIIEAKATSTDPESVEISHPEQLLYNRNRPLVLAVTRLARNREGTTLPEYVDNIFDTIRSRNPDDMESLRLILQSLGVNESVRNQFRNRWVINETNFYSIQEDSPVFPCYIIPDLPNEVRGIKYTLVTENFDSIDLADILQRG